MGGSSQDYLLDGWLGRYLQGEYAPYQYPRDFPDTAGVPDPLAIEFGSDLSPIFFQTGNIPTSISINNRIPIIGTFPGSGRIGGGRTRF